MSTALFSRDILEFLELLRTHRVRYLVVGGEAVIQYGHARFTADLDIFYEAAAANADRLSKALLEFWGGTVPGIESAGVLRGKGKVFQFGRPPNRVGFSAAWKGRKSERFTNGSSLLTVHFIGLEELIRNKRSAGRNKDLDDLRFLMEARKRSVRKPSRRSRPPRC